MTAPNSDHALVRPRPPAWYRWTVLVVISLAMFGNYYVYDAISPIADLLKSQLDFSDTNIGWLQAIYSMPNIFMVAIGGIIIDRVGVKKGVMLFGVLCLLGSAITAASGVLTYMAIGRLVFGLGAESLIVAVTCAVAKWFKGKELGLAFGINLTIARLGTVAALNSPTWARPAYENWQWPLLISVAIGALCVVGPLVYWFMEDSASRRYELGMAGATDKMVFSDLFQFNKSFFLVVLMCVTFYSAIFPFITFGIKFFMEVHEVTRERGGFLLGMLPLATAIFTPIFGYVADLFGKRASFMMLGAVLLVPVYLAMAYTNVPLIIPMAMMGIAFSLIPAMMWPSVAYIVEEQRLGTAYGVMTMIQNIGMGGMNLAIGWANDFSGASADNPMGHALGMWMFTGLALLAVLFAWLLRRHENGPDAHGLETITVRSSG